MQKLVFLCQENVIDPAQHYWIPTALQGVIFLIPDVIIADTLGRNTVLTAVYKMFYGGNGGGTAFLYAYTMCCHSLQDQPRVSF